MFFQRATTLLFLFAAVPAGSGQTAPNNTTFDSKVDSVREVAITIRSINATDEDFSDLEPLVQKIGSARVVVLGEATHSHGTTSSAKARFARFLHKRMGFDVLAWESGLLQAYAINTALRNTTVALPLAKSYLMAGGWASQAEIHPLFEYARASWQTGRPLEMAGFDSGKPHITARYFKAFFTAMAEREPGLQLSGDDWSLVDNLLKRGYGFISSELPGNEVRELERAVLGRLLKRLHAYEADLLKAFSPRELTVAKRFVADALFCEELRYIRLAKGAAEWNAARDRFMADNLLWLMRELYPGRKVIVWAATAHLIRNSTLIKNVDQPDWYTSNWEMGNHIYPVLKDDLYTIAFTSHSGTAGDIFPEGYGVESSVVKIEDPPEGSFEALAHLVGIPYLFVDVRGAPSGHPLKGEFVSVALGRAVNNARWSRVIDAFFFIDKAEANRHLPRDE